MTHRLPVSPQETVFWAFSEEDLCALWKYVCFQKHRTLCFSDLEGKLRRSSVLEFNNFGEEKSV
jgi:hypothetical protein